MKLKTKTNASIFHAVTAVEWQCRSYRCQWTFRSRPLRPRSVDLSPGRSINIHLTATLQKRGSRVQHDEACVRVARVVRVALLFCSFRFFFLTGRTQRSATQSSQPQPHLIVSQRAQVSHPSSSSPPAPVGPTHRRPLAASRPLFVSRCTVPVQSHCAAPCRFASVTALRRRHPHRAHHSRLQRSSQGRTSAFFFFCSSTLRHGCVRIDGRTVGERRAGRAARGHAGRGGAGAQAAAARNRRMVGRACTRTAAAAATCTCIRAERAEAATEAHDGMGRQCADRRRCLSRLSIRVWCAAARARSSSRCRFYQAQVSMRGRFRRSEKSFTQTFSTPSR